MKTIHRLKQWHCNLQCRWNRVIIGFSSSFFIININVINVNKVELITTKFIISLKSLFLHRSLYDFNSGCTDNAMRLLSFAMKILYLSLEHYVTSSQHICFISVINIKEFIQRNAVETIFRTTKTTRSKYCALICRKCASENSCWYVKVQCRYNTAHCCYLFAK